MNQYCIKVKRKGFNYYTDYMERYFENAAVQYGYHLTKRRNQAELWCVTFASEPSAGASKWITMILGSCNDITYEQLDELSCKVGTCFKSESVVDLIDDGLLELFNRITLVYEGKNHLSLSSESEIARKYGMPHIWYFSRDHSAFDEPIYISEAETVFKVVQHDVHLTPGKNFMLGTRNIGGGSRGLTVNTSFCTTGEVDIESPTLIIPSGKRSIDAQRIPLDMARIDTCTKTIFCAALPDFMIQDGFNEYSAKLSGRKKHDVVESCCIYVLFKPCGNEVALKSMEIEMIPNAYPMNKAIYKYQDENKRRHLRHHGQCVPKPRQPRPSSV